MRAIKEYPLDAKTIFGLSTMRWINVAASSMMTSAFMLYMPDYSGITHDVTFKDVVTMFKQNKALWISQLSGLISSLVLSFLMVATTYYLKWAYGPENLGTLSAVWGASILFGFVTGTARCSRSPILF